MSNTEAESEKVHTGTFHINMLIDKNAAGIVIGRGGSVISNLERTANCSLQLSPLHLLFPRTNERILLLQGSPKTVTAGILAVLDQIWTYNSTNGENTVPCRLAVPLTTAAAIIGKGGGKIQTLQADTGAQIQVSERQDGIVERIVTINGCTTDIKAAVTGLVDNIADDRSLNSGGGIVPARTLLSSSNISTNISSIMPQLASPYAAPYNVNTYGQPGGGSIVSNHHCQIEVHVPDSITGYVLGKRGAFLQHLINATRAQIKVSAKGDTVPGTTLRRFILSGTLSSVHAAHTALVVRLAEAKHDRGEDIMNNNSSNNNSSNNSRGDNNRRKQSLPRD